MKTVYLLMYCWTDFETHNDILGVYETKELAEKTAEEYCKSIDPDDEVYVEEALLNHFVWEKENNND